VTRALADLTWPEAETIAAADPVLAVPVGSTEQHGPHLPLSTDTDIAVALVELLRRGVPEVVAAPAIPYGASGEHQSFAGTVSVGREAVELLLVELCRSASKTFSRIVLVSAHGGNAAPVARVVERLLAEGRDVRAWSPPWDGDAHAGRIETSVMLALHAGRVALEHAAPGNTAPLGELLDALRADGVAAVSPNGVLGDPTGASALEGLELLEAAAAELIGAVTSWAPGAAAA
jgi:creatinine amidohydrolase